MPETPLSSPPLGATLPAKPRLEGRMGAVALALTVLAYSAPIAVASGFLSLTIAYGGAGSTFAFLVTTVLLVLFSVGYVAMAKRLPIPGGFYAFISTGLGKITRLGSAFLAAASYLVNLAGVYGFIGVTMVITVHSFGGGETPWWLWGAIAWAIVSLVGSFQIDFSAKILSVVMILEVAIVLVFNVAVFIHGGAEGLSFEPWTPTAFFEGNVPVTLLFCVLVFFGFEATALFRDEVKQPDRTIPRATLSAVTFIGVLYTVTQYALYSAYGSAAADAAGTDPAAMFGVAIGQFVAPVFTQIVLIMVITSEIASLIAIHNVATRYVHNIALDGAAPAYLGVVHPRHKSPHRASIFVAIVAAIILLPFIIAGVDGTYLYAVLIGLGAVGILLLMALVSASVVAWFGRNEVPASENVWTVFVAPGLAALTLGATAIFAAANFDLVGGGAPGQNTPLLLILVVAFIAGVCIAYHFRTKRAELYQGLGRADRIVASDET